MENQHSIRVTKPKCELQYQSSASTGHFFRTGILYLKIARPIIFIMAPWESVLHFWVLSYDRYRTGLFLANFATLAKSSKNNILCGICHSSAPIKAKLTIQGYFWRI